MRSKAPRALDHRVGIQGKASHARRQTGYLYIIYTIFIQMFRRCKCNTQGLVTVLRPSWWVAVGPSLTSQHPQHKDKPIPGRFSQESDLERRATAASGMSSEQYQGGLQRHEQRATPLHTHQVHPRSPSPSQPRTVRQSKLPRLHRCSPLPSRSIPTPPSKTGMVHLARVGVPQKRASITDLGRFPAPNEGMVPEAAELTAW